MLCRAFTAQQREQLATPRYKDRLAKAALASKEVVPDAYDDVTDPPEEFPISTGRGRSAQKSPKRNRRSSSRSSERKKSSDRSARKPIKSVKSDKKKEGQKEEVWFFT